MHSLELWCSLCLSEWAAACIGISLLVGLWLCTLTRNKSSLVLHERRLHSVPELALCLSLQHLSAKDLTVMSCVSPAMDEAACEREKWKVLWRSRYRHILDSVPESLRDIDADHEHLAESSPMLVLLSCLENLEMPPRWWIKEQQISYSDHAASLQEQFSARKQWKLFYFVFGMHWQKWAVAGHAREDDCLVVIHGAIFNMTHFDYHPGGKEPFMRFAGFDATEAFEAMGHSWFGKYTGFGEELLVDYLRLPQEGSIIRPAWLIRQDAMPPWKKWLYEILMLNANRELSYHDFWQS